MYFKVNDAKRSTIDLFSDKSCELSFNFLTTRILSCSVDVTDLETFDFATLTTALSSSLPTSLAKFHNSDLANPADWLALSWGLPESGYSRQAFPSDIQINIYHRSFGSRTHPEDEISKTTTSITTTNLEALNKRKLFNPKQVIYFSLRFVGQDLNEVPHIKDNILSRFTGSLSDYFTSQRDSVPLQLVAGAAGVFLVMSLVVLVSDQGKHSL